jgi:hypothetical protein
LERYFNPDITQEPAKIQQSFSSAKFPTVWRTLPLLEFLQQSWRNMAAIDRFSDMKDSISCGLENLEKWYRKTNDTDVYFICLGTTASFSFINFDLISLRALDPNYKTEYAEHQWDREPFINGMDKLKAKVSFLPDIIYFHTNQLLSSLIHTTNHLSLSTPLVQSPVSSCSHHSPQI